MNQELLNRLLKTFKIEAEEHIKSMSEGLINYEKSRDEDQQQNILETVYRAAHSLKGAARAVNIFIVEELCQNIENVFSSIRKKELETSFELFDLLHSGVDLISNYLSTEDESEKSEFQNEIDSLTITLKEILVGEFQSPLETKPPQPKVKKADPPKSEEPVAVKTEPIEEEDIKEKEIQTPVAEVSEEPQPEETDSVPKSEKKPASAKPATLSDTVRITTSKLDSMFAQTEEMLSVKQSFQQSNKDLNELKLFFDAWKTEWERLRKHLLSSKEFSVGTSQLNKLHPNISRLNEFITYNDEFIERIFDKLRGLQKSSLVNNQSLNIMVGSLLKEMKRALMLPFSYLLDIFPKMTREISRELGKEIALEISGEGIEIDRRILEEMKDAMIHLIRNSIDHGIEDGDTRSAIGKDRKGKIDITIDQTEGNKVQIIINDDGKGIDAAAIKEKAFSKGIIDEKEANAMSDEDAAYLIFKSEVSTSKTVTQLSGRGLGMAIVKEKVEKLGGIINIKTEKGKGTEFSIVLPLSLATFRGIIVEVSKRLFVLPTLSVEKVTRIKISDIKSLGNKRTLLYLGKPIPLVSLKDILQLDDLGLDREFQSVVILGSINNKIAFLVDDIINEQEIVVKPLSKQLEHLKNITGASILGDGQVVPILNIHEILKSVEDSDSHFLNNFEEIGKVKPVKILVTDDSLTSRTLLKDILESNGYIVKLASDGKEAITLLKSEKFDLLVSDIEMPNMDGLELTRNVRNNDKLLAIPIILISGLDSVENKELGINAGANAYIVKKEFRQEVLLKTVEMLLNS